MLFNNAENFFQDDRGFLWILTASGLFRFDGNHLKTFRSNPIDLNSLSSSRVKSMVNDENGVYWISTHDGGLTAYNSINGKYTQYHTVPNDENTISSDNLTQIVKDEDGKLWIGSNNGLNHFDPKTGKCSRHLPSPGKKGKLQGTFIGSIALTPERIYVGTTAGFEYLDRKTQVWHFFPNLIANGAPIAPSDLITAVLDLDGKVWISYPLSTKIWMFDPVTNKISNAMEIPFSTQDEITSIMVDKKNQVWVTSYEQIWRISADRKSVTHCLSLNQLEKEEDASFLIKLFEDKQGFIWLSTNSINSIYYFDPQQELFAKLPIAKLEAPLEASTLLFDSGNNLWANTEVGLCRYNLTNKKSQLIDIQHINKITPIDQHKMLLSRAEGLFLFYNNTEKYKELKLFDASMKSFGYVLDAKYDNDGDLWVSTWDDGLYWVPAGAINETTGTIKTYHQWLNIPGDPTSLPNNKLQRLLVTKNNEVYVSGYTCGLTKVDKKTKKVQSFLYKQGDLHGISANYTLWMLEDLGGDIWVTTQLDGLNRFSPKTGQFKKYNTNNGIPDEPMMTLAMDASGKIWMNNRKGLLRIDPQTDVITCFGSRSNFGAGYGPVAFHPNTGDVYFNALDGVRHFSPKTLENLITPALKIALVDINYYDQKTRSHQEIQPEALKKGNLILPHSVSNLHLNLSMYDFQDKQSHHYEYSLVKVGKNPQWVEVGATNAVQIAQLAPGEYLFSVKGTNGKGQTAALGNALHITILQPWWNSRIAWIGYILVFMLASWQIYKFLLHRNKIIQQKIILEKSLLEKETLLREIHHRVKNNLQIISSLLEKQSMTTKDEMTKKLLKEGQGRIFSMALVHENLYQSADLNAIVIKSYIEMLTKHIQLSQNSSEQSVELRLDIDDTTVNIDTAIPLGLILNELLTNCYKYAFTNRQNGVITLVFRHVQNQLIFTIHDNGIGLPHDFDKQARRSMGLNLVAGLVRQLDGTFTFTSDEEGSLFAIQCPYKTV